MTFSYTYFVILFGFFYLWILFFAFQVTVEACPMNFKLRKHKGSNNCWDFPMEVIIGIKGKCFVDFNNSYRFDILKSHDWFSDAALIAFGLQDEADEPSDSRLFMQQERDRSSILKAVMTARRRCCIEVWIYFCLIENFVKQ